MIKIYVTRKDIRLGQRYSHINCPIARAIKRRTKESYSVHRYFVSRSINDLTYNLPDEASKFIESFDSKENVKPFKFDINLPLK